MKSHKNRILDTNKKRIVAGAFAISVAMAILAVEFPNPADFNPTWESAKPGTSYSTDLPTAALLGNGALGAVNGGDGNHKKFVLTRGDLWSCGDFTYGKTRNSNEPTLERNFKPGETVDMRGRDYKSLICRDN